LRGVGCPATAPGRYHSRPTTPVGGCVFLCARVQKGPTMPTNRILQHLSCDCCRRRQRDERLQRLADELTDAADTDLVHVHSYGGELHAIVGMPWTIMETQHAAAELAELLKEIAHNLSVAACR